VTKRDNWASPAELAEALKSGDAGVRRALNDARKQRDRKSVAENEPAPALTTSRIMANAWEQIAKEVLPLSATPQQTEWARRFFYAGAKMMMDNLLYTDTLDEKNETGASREEINRVDAIWHELNEFFCRLGALQ
jgi:hypothetical protein